MSGENTEGGETPAETFESRVSRLARESIGYYDRQGNPMTLEQWAKTFEDPNSKRVAETTIGDWWVSTVWLGLDHGFESLFERDDDPEPYRPVIFETMIFYRHPEAPIVRRVGGMDELDERIAAHNAALETLHPELQELDQTWQRYHTEEEALAGHDRTCVDLRVLLANIAMAEELRAEAIKANAPSILSQPKEEGL